MNKKTNIDNNNERDMEHLQGHRALAVAVEVMSA